MKKLFALLLCLLLFAGAAMAEGEKYFISGEELVLFERDGVRLSLTGAWEGFGSNSFFSVAVDNAGDKDLYISYKVEGDDVYRSFGNECMEKGKVTEDVMCLPIDMQNAEAVSLTILVEDFEMWDELFTEDVTVHFNAERDGMVFKPECEFVLFEQDGVRMAFTGAVEEGEVTRLIAAVNNASGGDITVACAQTGFEMAVPAGQTLEGAMEFALPYADLDAMEFDFTVSGALAFEVQKQIVRFKAPLQTLEKGSRGTDVQMLQQKLINLGYLDGAADGIYGSMTAAAVQAFQAAEGLQETGIADAKTQYALFAE